jgi:hypothetical protein
VPVSLLETLSCPLWSVLSCSFLVAFGFASLLIFITEHYAGEAHIMCAFLAFVDCSGFQPESNGTPVRGKSQTRIDMCSQVNNLHSHHTFAPSLALPDPENHFEALWLSRKSCSLHEALFTSAPSFPSSLTKTQGSLPTKLQHSQL